MLVQIFFFYFAVVIVGSAVMVIVQRNPMHSALWLLCLFFHIAGLYVMLDAELLAAIQVVVYAGAILVLYLFAIMLLNIRREEITRQFHKGSSLLLLIGVLILTEILMITGQAHFSGPVEKFSIAYIKQEGNAQVVGKVLFTQFLFPFEIASLILLIGMVGAIILAKKRFD
ncbi:MAG: NADH-quinone oxidoreductase subunit J [Nitrospirae bacterium]|nr:NADH-quinone oxidoreductase subunit J [Nitrospirota bacterium]